MTLRSVPRRVARCGVRWRPDEQIRATSPQTAQEKQLREAQASGDVDQPGTKWGGWRYQGERQDCFFVVGRSCFKT